MQEEKPGYETFEAQFVDGGCDLPAFEHAEVNRSWLISQRTPFIIRGATASWGAHSIWDKEGILKKYGGDAYHLERSGAVSLSEVLARDRRYNMGHVVFPREDCYRETYRPYSPFLSTIAEDYDVPEYLLPMKTFQMGIGSGEGVGVPPEDHPSAWFAAVKGRKRWALHPPRREEPPYLMKNAPRCGVTRKTQVSLLCDQLEGDIIWVPDFWWHETCGLDGFSAGIGGITYEGADNPGTQQRTCAQEVGEYAISDIPYCKSNPDNCPSL